MRRELNVLALVKGDERYVFLYDDDCRGELIETFRNWAADPALSFSWFDAAVLTEKAKEQAAATESESSRPPSRIAGS